MRLTKLEERWLREVLSGFASDGDVGLSADGHEVDWSRSFTTMARASNAQARLGMRAAIWLAGLSPAWLDHRAATLSSLDGSERAALLSRLLAHPSFAVRELTLLLKLQSSFALLGTHTARARSAFDRDRPPPVDTPDGRTKLPVLGRAGGES